MCVCMYVCTEKCVYGILFSSMYFYVATLFFFFFFSGKVDVTVSDRNQEIYQNISYHNNITQQNSSHYHCAQSFGVAEIF